MHDRWRLTCGNHELEIALFGPVPDAAEHESSRRELRELLWACSREATIRSVLSNVYAELRGVPAAMLSASFERTDRDAAASLERELLFAAETGALVVRRKAVRVELQVQVGD
jgi:hypothetical protein